jgi:prepilin-type N-terminal cleavage/methylation domain-containing protein
MKLKRNRSGFTLLEVIIVIIIVGVLASLALPRFFSTVEYSRATEAMQSIASTRQSIERCYLMTSNYSNCNNFATLDLDDPGTSPNNHFTYAISSGANTYRITATRNTRDGGNGGTVVLNFNGTDITRSGTGPFGAIQ